VGVNLESVLHELEGLRALARSLVRGPSHGPEPGDADADDLLQDTAIAALEHPPARTGTPLRAWLAAVLRNRWRMDRRGAARRRAREYVAIVAEHAEPAERVDPLDRARALEKLAAALVALDEPFRAALVRRYLDGRTAAQIARELGIPAGTVRWRISTGLARLRAAVDSNGQPRWQRALAPFAPITGAAVKTKTSTALVLVLILLLGLVAAVWFARDRPAPAPGQVASAPGATAGASGATADPAAPRSAEPPAPPAREPTRGQARPTVEPSDAAGGVIAGRVINWSTGDGVASAELTFTSDAGALTIRSADGGAFELAPGAPGHYRLAAIAAPGFLPYAPELLHSTVHVTLARGRAVRGVTVFLFPALDYRGTVVDARGAPVAGARVRLLGTPAGEQAIDKLQTEWTSDRDGRFTFHAADDAVLEASRGRARGWARVGGGVTITRQLTIALGDAPARDATIEGRAIDKAGAPIADVLVRAAPAVIGETTRSTAFATTGPDGEFVLAGLDREAYDLAAHADGHAPAELARVRGGTRDVIFTLDPGLPLGGAAVDGNGAPVPSYTLLVSRRDGAARELVVARSIVDPRGRFEVRVPRGDYELLAAATGWAPSASTTARAGTTDVELTLSAGATLRGVVIADDDRRPIPYARVMRESSSGGASAQPANAGTVTRPDGTFELTGIPPGSLSISVAAGGFHPRIEAAMTALDGAELGPITVALTRLADGEQPRTELVGIGIQLAPDGDALRVERVIAGGGAEAAGIVAGDHVIAIDGAPVGPLGVEGAVAKIRGVVGTTIGVTLRRAGQPVQLVVERRKMRA
jgi:RNA polymerase sigma factor (sigma-70 family)